MKKILAILFAVSMLLTSFTAVYADDPPFSDVKKSDWFYNDVKTAYESGIINGKSATEYKPDDNMTYAEAIKLAACINMLALEGNIDFESGEPWYQPYVDYCTENKIISKDYDFNKNATRSGYMEIFANCLPDNLLKAINYIEDDSIPDVPITVSYASAVYKLYRAGILMGVDDEHNCNPAANIKRSEVAAILTRMNDKDARVEFTMGDPENNKDKDNTNKDNTDKDNTDKDNTDKDNTDKDKDTETKELTAKLSPSEAILSPDSEAEFIVIASGGKEPYTYLWKAYINKTSSGRVAQEGTTGYYLTDETVSDFPEAQYGDASIKFTVTRDFFKKYKALSCEVKDADGNSVTTNKCTISYGGDSELINDLTTDNVLMYVEDKIWITDKGPVVTGRIVNGTIKTGDAVKIVNSDGKPITATVEGIEMFRKSLDEAKTGDNVGLLLGGLGNDKDTAFAKIEKGAAICGYNDKYTLTDYVEGIFTPSDGTAVNDKITENYEVNVYYGGAADRNAYILDWYISGDDDSAYQYIGLDFDGQIGVWYIGQILHIRKGGKEIGTLEITYIPYPYWLED